MLRHRLQGPLVRQARSRENCEDVMFQIRSMDVRAGRELGEQLTFPRPAKCSEEGFEWLKTEVQAVRPDFGALSLYAGSGVVVRHCLFKAG